MSLQEAMQYKSATQRCKIELLQLAPLIHDQDIHAAL
jgi:hypothetical protein